MGLSVLGVLLFHPFLEMQHWQNPLSPLANLFIVKGLKELFSSL
jgi:hypothetical protein